MDHEPWKIAWVAEMQEIERQADASGLSYATMMENAGRGLAGIVEEVYGYLGDGGVIALVGGGNNGGDALVALSVLSQQGWPATAYLAVPRPKDDPLLRHFLLTGGEIIDGEFDREYQQLLASMGRHAVLLDGLLGTGFHLPLRPNLAELLAQVTARLEEIPTLHIVAVDCPSGVDCDSGEAAPETLAADLTVTMAAIKPGLLSFPAAQLCGDLRLAPIGDLSAVTAWQMLHRHLADADMARAGLPSRPADAHKGTFGTAMICAGSQAFTGAALLAGEAAYRSGAGLVTMAVPEGLHTALAGHLPEATWLLLPQAEGAIAANAAVPLLNGLRRATAMLIGPGFGTAAGTAAFIEKLFEQSDSLPPVIVDADGLRLLTALPDWAERLPELTVLTPHPGEMSAMTGLSRMEIQENRLQVAERFAKEWGHVLMLKGANTIVAGPDGRTVIIPVAHPALARAGSGDVLAGIICGLRAQGIDAFQAAVTAGWLHAQAGILAAERQEHPAAVLARDMIAALGEVMANMWD